VRQAFEQFAVVALEIGPPDPHRLEHGIHVRPVDRGRFRVLPRIDGPFEPSLLGRGEPRQGELDPGELPDVIVLEVLRLDP
jgi:hypothetical protein